MKQIRYSRYGSPEVLNIIDTEIPAAQPGYIVIKSHYTAVNASDARIRASRFPKGYGFIARPMFGLLKPRNQVLGGCFSGVVHEVGENVSNLQVGDRVCGMTGIAMGCYGEYILVKSNYCTVKVTDDVSLDEACAGLFGGTSALHFLRDVALAKKGEKILINGASGSVGTALVQLSTYFGLNVVGISGTSNLNLISQLGASECLDYTTLDLNKHESKYDIIIDAVGNLRYEDIKHILTPSGRFIVIAGDLYQTLQGTIGFGKNKVIRSSVAPEKPEDVQLLLNMISKNEFKPVISSIFDYTDIVDAHSVVDSGRKVGNILIKW